ncbi:hypothetical protein FLK61_27305 [Paenalkalicoccus suaedae]|uniref:Ribosomal protein L7/L12 C-terminal domain-containing protein n=1 Tax=Paenalkalicoccus suaedae TaxID=2592382 RepID=A0A859FD15_9BACI|nr:hypothetical protein [Paenalkalicoccus suaedae]QKS70464.1 hypothetical protein FLK61_27305 [Paenalkalicoccus suaedae]
MATILSTAALLAIFYIALKVSSLHEDVRNLHYKLDRLMREQHVEEVDHDLNVKLKELKENQSSVKAVKALREETGLSLIEAKQYVDKL